MKETEPPGAVSGSCPRLRSPVPEENARGHLVITAPTGGSAGVMPAVLYSLGPDGAKKSDQKLREALLAAPSSAICASTTRRCRRPKAAARPRSASPRQWAAAAIAQAHGRSTADRSQRRRRLRWSTTSAMTCDPVAGFVQIPCIERCAFGAVKSWTGYLIARNEIPANRRVDSTQRDQGAGHHGQGDEPEVQGDVGRRPRRVPDALLTAR